MYGVSEKPMSYYNGVKITESEIVMKKIGTKEWKTSFNREPAKVSIVH